MTHTTSYVRWFQSRAAVLRFIQLPLVEDDRERGLAGLLGGVLWIGGGVVILLPRLLGGAPKGLPLLVALVLAGGSFLWGAVSVWAIDWVDGPAWQTHVTAGFGLIVLSCVVYLTGAVRSPGWPYFTWLALYGCFFFHRRAAIGYMLLALLAQSMGLILDPDRALHDGYGWQLAIVLFGYGSVGTALIRGKETMVRLRRQAEWEADTDRVTGLANHRRMDRELQGLTIRARETGQQFVVAVIDVDHLKQITDVRGHDASDRALADIAQAMELMAGSHDVLARTGGDEFTWVMPDTPVTVARDRIDATRTLLAASKRPFALRFSAGVCDSIHASEPRALVGLAEGALYWSKVHGRNQTQIYDRDVIDVLSANERAEMLQRSQALIGLQALARAIDAKDPATRQHSERVGVVAEGLARSLGWGDADALLLRDAALVHDVGKIGIDDAVLRKPMMLTPDERAHVNSHAEISARIVDGVLSPEQVSWIRTHHERADGSGYPLGLDASEIPVGGALLAIADAYDAMTAGRPYCDGRAPAEVLLECRAQVGRHFTHAAVAALERWMGAPPEPVQVRDAVRAASMRSS